MFEMLTDEQAEDLSPEGWLVELERLQVHLNKMDVYGAWLFARAEAAGAAAVMGERSLVDALRKRLGISQSEARRRRRTSKSAADERIREGMENGSLNADQANALAGADVDEDVRDELIEDAKSSSDDADTTRRKAHEAEREAAAARGEDPVARQRRRRSGRRFVDHNGMWNLHLSLDSETGAQIDAVLSAENKRLWRSDKDSAGHADGDLAEAGRDRSPQQRMADAAANLLLGGQMAARSVSGPAARPIKPEMVVSIGLETLATARPFTQVDSIGGVPMTIEALRRAACDTAVVPAVLGGPSEVLDLGRTVRSVSKAQKRALALRDGGCVWPGCSAPPSDCDAHHVRHWVHGGATDLSNLALLCHTHHHHCHEGGYELWAHPPREDGTARPGWMIHDSGGMPKWPTRVGPVAASAQPSPQPAAPKPSECESATPGSSAKRSKRRPPAPRGAGSTVWTEPPLFDEPLADTG